MATKVTDEQIAQALNDTRGAIGLAARKLGCTRVTVWRRVQASDMLKELCHDLDEERVDIAEAKLGTLVMEDHWDAIRFTLRTKGRSRGYGDRSDVDITSAGKALGVAGLVGLSLEQLERIANGSEGGDSPPEGESEP